jgi:hypothetical protein
VLEIGVLAEYLQHAVYREASLLSSASCPAVIVPWCLLENDCLVESFKLAQQCLAVFFESLGR